MWNPVMNRGWGLRRLLQGEPLGFRLTPRTRRSVPSGERVGQSFPATTKKAGSYNPRCAPNEWVKSKRCSSVLEPLECFGRVARRQMTIEPYPDGVACAGPNAPKCEQVEDLIRLLVTIHHRWGNTAVRYRIQWGANALWAEDEQKRTIDKLTKQLRRLKKRMPVNQKGGKKRK